MDNEGTQAHRRKQCAPCWVALIAIIPCVIFGGAWVMHVIDMVFSGRGLDVMSFGWGGEMHYVSAFVLICAAAIAGVVAAFLNFREYLISRDFDRRYGRAKSNNTVDRDARQSDTLGSP